MRLFYFNTLSRYSMKVDVFDDRFIVYLPGTSKDVAYKEMYKTFLYRNLYVLRARQDEKSWDIIIDLRELDSKKKREFMAFMKEKQKEFLDKTLVDEPWVIKHE